MKKIFGLLNKHAVKIGVVHFPVNVIIKIGFHNVSIKELLPDINT